jgi:hypothetical protein
VTAPGATASLREALEKTLTLHLLWLPGLLRVSLASRNTVRRALSVDEGKAGWVKRWR